MSYGNISWIADELLDDEDEKRHVISVRVQDCMFGNTAGPYGGIGGSAMTPFTMTEIVLADKIVIFADRSRMGTVKIEYRDLLRARFPFVRGEWIDKEG